jgi:probable HAF family extracellular repeat protein
MQVIPPVGTDTNGVAFDLNNKGQVVGLSIGADGDRAFLYENGLTSDLNALAIQPNSLFLVLAQGINDEGEITGTAVDTNSGQTVGFLAVPVFDGSGSPPASSKAQTSGNSRQVVSFENVRRQLQHRPGLSGFVLRAMGSK